MPKPWKYKNVLCSSYHLLCAGIKASTHNPSDICQDRGVYLSLSPNFTKIAVVMLVSSYMYICVLCSCCTLILYSLPHSHSQPSNNSQTPLPLKPSSCPPLFNFVCFVVCQMRYQEQQKLQKHQKAEIAEHCLREADVKTVTGENDYRDYVYGIVKECIYVISVFSPVYFKCLNLRAFNE